MRQLPTSPHAECALLGALLLDPAAIPQAALLVAPEDFYGEDRRAVYAALLRVYAKDRDLTTLVPLVADLERTGTLAKLPGGEAALMKLADQTPSAVSWPSYARTVAEKSRLRRLIRACEDAAYRAYTAEDAQAACDEAVAAVGAAAQSRGGSGSVSFADALEGFLERMERKESSLYPTGLADFDREFGGFPRQGVATLLGPPASGKTSMANHVAAQVALRHGVGVRVYSFEMGPGNMSAAVTAARTDVPLHEHAQRGSLPTDGEWERVRDFQREMAGLDVRICTDNPTAQDIYTRTAAERGKVGCVVIDYVQNLPRRTPGQDDVAAIEEGCRVAQRISRELECLVLLVSQVTAAASRDQRAPKSSDGIGSGAIEQASDLIVGVYRPARWENPREWATQADGESWEDRKKYAELHVLKNKFGGQGVATVEFDGRVMKFGDKKEVVAW